MSDIGMIVSLVLGFGLGAGFSRFGQFSVIWYICSFIVFFIMEVLTTDLRKII